MKRRDVGFWQIVLQKSFCGMGLKFSEAWARRLNNDVGDHVATRQTHRRFCSGFAALSSGDCRLFRSLARI
jgi:hypothetical protein